MKKGFLASLILIYLLFVACLPAANAILERVGPVSNAPQIGGFPTWYSDTTGIALEFCAPLPGELENGHCLVLAGDVTIPEVFPTNFFDEHFFFSSGAVFPTNPLKKILWESALEGAFAAGVVPGGQATFTRIRMRLEDAPVAGTYIFRHPFGEETFNNVAAGDRIFFTDDVGINCAAGQFDCAMTGRLGPYLLPSNTPGGAELPAVAGTGAPGGGAAGKFYIADPLRVGPVTGGPIRNFVEIEGPAGAILDPANIAAPNIIRTENFTLMGRLYTGAIDSRMTVDRASYSRSPAELKVDVFATAFPTASSRLPTQLRPAPVAPVVSFFDRPCATTTDPLGAITGFAAPVGANEFPMAAQGNSRWAQAPLATLTDSVCVKDNSARNAAGQPVVAFHDVPVNDLVNITLAQFVPGDAGAPGTLTVTATSSDTGVPPTLTLQGLGNFSNVDLVSGAASLQVVAPPAKVTVLSSARGTDSENTTTVAVVAAFAPVAVNDTVSTNEDTAAANIPVLANDTVSGTATLAVVVNGTKGSATINADNTVTYTPNLNENGADTFTYTVTANGLTSNIATVSVNIIPVNDPPIAINDSTAGAVGTPLVIAVLANDTDVDGTPLAISAGSISAVTGPGSVKTATANADGTVTLNVNAAGTYSFTYQATDGALTSAPATVTVLMTAPEILNVTSAIFRTDSLRWIIIGTSTVSGQPITLSLTSGNAVPCNAEGRVIGSATVVGGAFTLDFLPAPANLDPRGTNCPNVKGVSTTGGVDPSTPIVVRR
jgi:hypothetical protein